MDGNQNGCFKSCSSRGLAGLFIGCVIVLAAVVLMVVAGVLSICC